MTKRIGIALAFLILAGSFAARRPKAADSLRNFELQPASPQFWNLISRDAKLSTVAGGFGFTEGQIGRAHV